MPGCACFNLGTSSAAPMEIAIEVGEPLMWSSKDCLETNTTDLTLGLICVPLYQMRGATGYKCRESQHFTRVNVAFFNIAFGNKKPSLPRSNEGGW